MVNKNKTLKIVSYNCQGLNSAEKRGDVLNYLKSKDYNIYCLQDTHFTEQEEVLIRRQWGGECIFNSFASNQGGVAIMFNNNFEFVIHKTKKDDAGNLIALDLTIEGKRVTLINIYGPNSDSPVFYDNIADILETYNNESNLVTGDFNLVLDQFLDTQNYIHINNPKAREKVLGISELFDLIDPYRELHPDVKRFTWRKRAPFKQARLDFFLVSRNFYHNIQNVKVENSYRSDHSPVVLEFKLSEFIIGKGLWKFNNALLSDIRYVQIVKEVIQKTKDQYAALVYDRENIKNIDDSELHLMINDQLFLETLLMEIRGKTISYGSFRKKEREKLENDLSNEIRLLEANAQTSTNFDLIEQKKIDLKNIRQDKMKGHFVRSKAQWIEEGEKPSKYFCHLESKNFVNKTIPKLVTENNIIIHDQNKILKEAKIYYQKLYTKLDALKNNNLETDLPYPDIPKLNDFTKNSLEGEITLMELLSALKRMKNGKSPGSDGYTSEFLKFFWIDIGKFILRSINFGYQKGEMSVTQKEGIITCIPKEDKPRQYLKNWRPITLLNTVYKLASSCIAERVKSVLHILINDNQTGFIPGRYIGENIRLIYDILAFTEENDIPGILLLIDFEKAFDTVSWDFIQKTLTFFNFGNSIIHWIKTFYNKITSCVTQNCFLSERFHIQRGCRQGDPLSPYIFILCAEILGLLIRKNKDIKGISIDDTEYTISQYADDTSLILDGTPLSLDASLRTLQYYAEISGLRMNMDKTNVI